MSSSLKGGSPPLSPHPLPPLLTPNHSPSIFPLPPCDWIIPLQPEDAEQTDHRLGCGADQAPTQGPPPQCRGHFQDLQQADPQPDRDSFREFALRPWTWPNEWMDGWVNDYFSLDSSFLSSSSSLSLHLCRMAPRRIIEKHHPHQALPLLLEELESGVQAAGAAEEG